MILIDGHNAIFRTNPYPDEDIPKAAHLLTGRIQSILARIRKKAILVFDGTGGISTFGSKKKLDPQLTIVYSGENFSADQWIINWVESHPGETVILVSDDQKLQQVVKRGNLSGCKVKEWFSQHEKKTTQQNENRKKHFGSVDHWLKEFGLDE